MSKGFDWRKFAPRKQFATLAAGGLVVIFSGLLLPSLFTSSGGTEVLSTNPGPQPPVIYDGPSLGTLLARLACGIIIVSGLIVATVGFLKHRQQQPKKSANSPVREIEILGTLAVGRGLVYHVKVGNQHMLAGTDAFGFKSLLQLPAPKVEIDTADFDEPPTIISERLRVTLPPRT